MATQKKNPYTDDYMSSVHQVRRDVLQREANKQLTERQKETIENVRAKGTAVEGDTALHAFAVVQANTLKQVTVSESTKTLVTYDKAKRTSLSEDSRNRLDAKIHATEVTMAGVESSLLLNWHDKVLEILAEPTLAPKQAKQAEPEPQEVSEVYYEPERVRVSGGGRLTGWEIRNVPKVRQVKRK